MAEWVTERRDDPVTAIGALLLAVGLGLGSRYAWIHDRRVVPTHTSTLSIFARFLGPFVVGLILVTVGVGLVERDVVEGLSVGGGAVFLWWMLGSSRPEVGRPRIGRWYLLVLAGALLILAVVLIYATLI